MQRFRKAVCSFFLACGILVSGLVVAPVAMAEPAQAYTTSACYDFYKQNIGTYTWSKWRSCYFDYTWWEESWLGGSHRDGRRSWPIGVTQA